MSKQPQGDLALPLYASKPQRRIPGTTCVAVTMYRSHDGSVASYAILTEDGKAHLGTAHFQHRRTMTRLRGYTLTAFALEMGRRNGLEVEKKVCGCCGTETMPPTPGTDEEGFYCEPCGVAWDKPEDLTSNSCLLHKEG